MELTPLFYCRYNLRMRLFRNIFFLILFFPPIFACVGIPSSPPSQTATEGSVSSASSAPAASQESPYRDLDKIGEGKIVHLPTGVELLEGAMIDLLAAARVIYVGEVHDSVEDHQVQLEILKGLLERFPGNVVVGMEMFRRPAQPQLNRWIQGDLSGPDFLKMWYENWGMDETYYEELFRFIQEKKIPVIALNVSQEMEAKVGMKGLKGLSEEDQKRLPRIDWDDPYHRRALEAIFKGHGTGAEGFGPFYDTMLLWDETMAESVANYLASPEGAGKKMVVFAGGFHVGYGFGIPRRVFRRFPAPYRIVLPYTKDIPEARRRQMMDVKIPEIPLILADFVWGVRYHEPENKKVRLGVQVEPFQAGIRVVSVSPGSAAEGAGIQPGDLVVSFDGKTLQEPFDLTYAVRQKKQGDRVRMEIIRDGKGMTVEVVLQSSRHP